MTETWAARFVDRGVHDAWLDLRVRLADRLAEGLAAGSMETIEISTATGESLTVDLDDDVVLVIAGGDIWTTENVDEAAHTVFTVLHDDWGVVHPAFLDTDLVELPDLSAERKKPIPSGYPESTEQLREWVVAAFGEGRDEPLNVDDDGDIPWRTPKGRSAYTRVINRRRVQTWAVLASNVDVEAAHRLADRWSRKYLGLTFFVVEDRLVMSDCVYAWPFVPSHVVDPLLPFLAMVDRLTPTARKVRQPDPAPAIDPALLALLPTARQLSVAELSIVVSKAAGSRARLREWRTVAHDQWAAVRGGPDEDLHEVALRLRAAWRRIFRASDLAMKKSEPRSAA